MLRLLQHTLRFMPLIFWLLIAIVSVLMLIEFQPNNNGFKYADKFEHAIVFIALTITGWLAYPQKKQRVYAGLVILGALYEVLQGLFTITRQASVYDWLADICGIILAIMIYSVINKQFKDVARI